MIGKLLVVAGIAVAPLAVPVFTAPAAQAGCDPGYVVGVPMSDGRLPVKCVPRNNVPPGYVDGTGGNAQPVPGTGHGYAYKSGFKTDPGWYGHNGPCNSNDVRVVGRDPQTGDAIERWGPQGCDPTLPMTGTN